jgi:hypothetical protein
MDDLARTSSRALDEVRSLKFWNKQGKSGMLEPVVSESIFDILL